MINRLSLSLPALALPALALPALALPALALPALALAVLGLAALLGGCAASPASSDYPSPGDGAPRPGDTYVGVGVGLHR